MGGRPPETTDIEILEVFIQSDDLVLSTREVSEKIAYSQPGTYKRLRTLEEKDWLGSKMLGDVRAWWLTDKGRTQLNKEHE